LAEKKITTAIDDFLLLVKEEGEISFADAAQRLGVDVDTINFWTEFLEEEGKASIKYNLFTPFVVYKDSEKSLLDSEGSLDKKIVKKVGSKEVKRRKGFLSGLNSFTKSSKKKERKKFDFSINEKLSLAKSKAHIKSIDSKLEVASKHKSKGEFDSSRKAYAEIINELKKTNSVINPKILSLKPSIGSLLKKKLSNLEKSYKKLSDDLEKKNFVAVSKSSEEIFDKIENTKSSLDKAIDYLNESQKNFLKKEDPEVLMEKVNSLIKLGSFDEAKRIYDIICDIYVDLPSDFEKNRRKLAGKIVEINKELGETLSKDSQHKLNKGINKVSHLVDKARKAVDKNDFEYADEIYSEVKDILKFFEKNQSVKVDEIRSKVLGFHSDMLNKKKKYFGLIFDEKEKEINGLIEEMRGNIVSKDKKKAVKNYEELIYGFKQLPKGFVKRKIEIYSSIIKEYEDLFPLISEGVDVEIESVKSEIDRLLKSLRSYYDRGNMSGMIYCYREIKRLYDSIKYDDFKEKSSIHKKITKTYNSYILRFQRALEKSSVSKLKDATKNIEFAEGFLNEGRYKEASESYDVAVGILKELPEEVIYINKKLRDRALLIYKKLLIEAPKMRGVS